ncbi:MAG: gliding motility-associated C-terminal domain-containing protein [bacterium]
MIVLFLVFFDSPIIITEVMSNVKGSEQTCGDRNEYVEIYNHSPDTIDLAGFMIYDFDVNSDEVCVWDDDVILLKYPGIRIHSTRIYPYSYAVILDREYTSNDTTGGNVQPYDFPDSTLILTTDDTTIGDGLQTADPLIIFSITSACTTSFGTPFDSLDYFPSDPGDGLSWERIELSLPDTAPNWHICIDSAGGTPGQENSTTNAFDLAITSESIIFQPAVLKTGDDVRLEIQVKNFGLRETDDYILAIYDDQNRDSILHIDEMVAQLNGVIIYPTDSTRLTYTYEHPVQGIHIIGFRVDFPDDRDLTNNLVLKELRVVGEIGELALSPAIFTPNNDGVGDKLQIDYRLPDAGGSLDLAIFDSRGKLVHFLCRDNHCQQAIGSMFWDGKVADKESPTGLYIIYLEYRFQNRVTKAKKTAILAR